MTTVKQIFEATLIELSKVQAPPVKIYEFNYFLNKVINQFVNKVYNLYDINQQTTDDVRVLKSSAKLKPTVLEDTINVNNIDYKIHVGSEVYLPLDYLHLLNCVCIFQVKKRKGCWNAGDFMQVPATRLTSDSWSNIMTDIYNRPTPMKPYYYLHNVNTQNLIPTNPVTFKDVGTGLDIIGTDALYDPQIKTKTLVDGNTYIDNSTYAQTSTELQIDMSQFARKNDTIQINQPIEYTEGEWDHLNNVFIAGTTVTENFKTSVSTIEESENSRIGNSSNIRCEIRYGKDNSIFELVEVRIDYLKVPQHIRFTEEQLDLVEDTSQIMEFPDYVNQEIINELVTTLMAHMNDPRLGTTVQINQSIARPTQQQEQPKK